MQSAKYILTFRCRALSPTSGQIPMKNVIPKGRKFLAKIRLIPEKGELGL